MPLFAASLGGLTSSLITAAIVVAALVLGQDILIPLTLAAILCFVLSPAVDAIMRRRVPQTVAVLLVLGATTGVIGLASYAMSAQLLNLTASLPQYQSNVAAKLKDVSSQVASGGALQRAIDAIDGYQRLLEQELKSDRSTPSGTQAVNGVEEKAGEKIIVSSGNSTSPFTIFEHAIESFAQVGLTFLFTLFLLFQYRDIRDRIVRVAGTDNISASTSAMSDAGSRLSNLFTALVLLNAGFGTFVAIALWVIGIPNPALWGAFAFLMRFIPFIGSFLAAIPPVLLSLAVDPGWTMTIATVALFVLGEPVMGHVLEPLLLGKRAGLSPFAMILSASFWTLVWGPLGLLLSAPITMICAVAGRYVSSLNFLTVLLSDEQALTPPQEFYHRLLSKDVISALNQLEAMEAEKSTGAAIDNIVLPALQMAAVDYKLGRLDAGALEALDDTVVEVLELLDGRVEEVHTAEVDDEAPILVVPARGPIDIVAAKAIAMCINRENSGLAVAPGTTSGITALSTFKSDQRNTEPDTVIIVNAGLLDAKQASLLGRKARALFPAAIIMTRTFGERPISQSGDDDHSDIATASRFDDIQAHAALVASRIAQGNAPKPRNDVAAA